MIKRIVKFIGRDSDLWFIQFIRIMYIMSNYGIAKKGLEDHFKPLRIYGGRYWVRTSDPCRVKAVLYR